MVEFLKASKKGKKVMMRSYSALLGPLRLFGSGFRLPLGPMTSIALIPSSG